MKCAFYGQTSTDTVQAHVDMLSSLFLDAHCRTAMSISRSGFLRPGEVEKIEGGLNALGNPGIW